MLNNLKKRKSEGFTIIEVMIVLAIAGLIMLIIFLAVPALQRNSRNTQYKNDSSAYAAAVAEWQQNNNGKTPAAVADVTAINTLVQLGKMTAPTTAPVSGARTTAVTVGSIELNTNAKCDTANIGNTVASSRAVAVRFSVETASASAKQCLDVN